MAEAKNEKAIKVNRAPVLTLWAAVVAERLGHEVVFPPGQTCCGQMHVNTGYRREAVPIVANHVRAFAGAEAVVAPSGSCVWATGRCSCCAPSAA